MICHDIPIRLGEGLSIIEDVGPSVCESKSAFALHKFFDFNFTSVRINLRTEDDLITEDAGPNNL